MNTASTAPYVGSTGLVRVYWQCPCGLGGVVDGVPDDYTAKLGAMYDQHRDMVFVRSGLCGGGHASIRATIRMADIVSANVPHHLSQAAR